MRPRPTIIGAHLRKSLATGQHGGFTTFSKAARSLWRESTGTRIVTAESSGSFSSTGGALETGSSMKAWPVIMATGAGPGAELWAMPGHIAAAIVLAASGSPEFASDHPAGIASQTPLAGAKRGDL